MNKFFGWGLAALISLTTLSAWGAVPQTPSGLLLGVFATPSKWGLRVAGVIPNTPAEGVLRTNDKIVRVTDGTKIFVTPSILAMENAKDQIGMNVPAALEVVRPGQGFVYLWVTFIPVEPPVPTAKPSAKALLKMDPQAKELFKRAESGQSGNANSPNQGTNPFPN
jgi:hypothetical protein